MLFPLVGIWLVIIKDETSRLGFSRGVMGYKQLPNDIKSVEKLETDERDLFL